MAESMSHLHEGPGRKSFIICIGNSDDKLSQDSWSQFVAEVNDEILEWEYERHYSGGSMSHDRYQNYAWIVEVMDDPGAYDRTDIDTLKDALDNIRVRYEQESILFAEFKPDFITRPRKR